MDPNQIDSHLKTLSLHRIREIYRQEAANDANTSASVNRKIQLATLPQVKRLEEFEPKINEKLIQELATLEFLTTAKNVS